MVAVDQIELDTSNPRIAHLLEHQEPPYTADMIHLALQTGGDEEERAGPTFTKLKQSILTNGGIVQPVILVKGAGGKYRCIEGNTRVFLYRDFRDKKIKGSWSSIPALVHSELPSNDVHAIRLQVHLVGPRQWDPYSKAKYLHYLRNEEHLPLAQIVDLCGGNERSIVESLYAYEDIEKYYRPLVGDENFDVRKFSGFVELQKPGVKQAILEARCDLTNFSEWIRDERIERLQYVRRLQAVLRDEKAKKVFLAEGMEEALKLLDRPHLNEALEEADLSQLARALRQAIDTIPYGQFSRLKHDPGETTITYLQEVRDSINGLFKDLDLENE